MEKDVLLFLAGLVVGFMNAVAGGGMLIGFPALIALGTPALMANAVGNVVTLPGQVTTAFGYRRYLRKVPKSYAWLILPLVVGSAIGALVLRNTSSHDFTRLVPGLVLFGVILFTIQPLLHFHLHRHLKGRAKTALPLLLLGAALVPLSIYGGYFGAGYGIILLAFLGLTNLPDTHMMNAMKNVSAVFVAGTTIVCLWGSGLINWRIGLIMGAGSALGGYLGARSAQRLSSHWLRVCIILIGIAAVAYLGLRDY
jgi:uncharacterized membrane protein YfcA